MEHFRIDTGRGAEQILTIIVQIDGIEIIGIEFIAQAVIIVDGIVWRLDASDVASAQRLRATGCGRRRIWHCRR